MSLAGRNAQDLDRAREFCVVGICPPFAAVIETGKAPEAIALDPNRFPNGNSFCLNTFLIHFFLMGVHSIS
jgi:hypothetical protein